MIILETIVEGSMSLKILRISLLSVLIILLLTAVIIGSDNNQTDSQKNSKKDKAIEKLVKAYELKFGMNRHEEGIAAIIELFETHKYYTPETLYKICRGYKQLFNNSSNKNEKVKILEQLYAYSDTLDKFCENDKNKKEDKNNCRLYMYIIDSLSIESRNEIYGDK